MPAEKGEVQKVLTESGQTIRVLRGPLAGGVEAGGTFPGGSATFSLPLALADDVAWTRRNTAHWVPSMHRKCVMEKSNRLCPFDIQSKEESQTDRPSMMTGCELAFPSAPFLLLVDGSPPVPPLATLLICGSEAPAKLVEMSAMAVKVFPSLKRTSDLHGVRQCHDTYCMCLRGVPANCMLAALTN
jgi:hypothetical protein